jgi:hypothetical protein
MVAGDVFVRDDLAANHHRVDGGAVHATNNGAVLVRDDLAANHHRVLHRVEGSAFHALIVTGAVHAVLVGSDVTAAVQAAILPTLGEGVRV